MLSRRHIRVKVMQSLYSYLSTKVNEIPVAERAMLKHFDEVVELKLVIISLWIQLVKHADNFYDEGKKKHLPTALDLNPNTRFVDNDIITWACPGKPSPDAWQSSGTGGSRSARSSASPTSS